MGGGRERGGGRRRKLLLPPWPPAPLPPSELRVALLARSGGLSAGGPARLRAGPPAGQYVQENGRVRA